MLRYDLLEKTHPFANATDDGNKRINAKSKSNNGNSTLARKRGSPKRYKIVPQQNFPIGEPEAPVMLSSRSRASPSHLKKLKSPPKVPQ